MADAPQKTSAAGFAFWVMGVLLMGAGGATFLFGGWVAVLIGFVLLIVASNYMPSKQAGLMILLGLFVAGGIAAAGCGIALRGL